MAKKLEASASQLSEVAGFDMTPMIDVTFLLIIFFMCVTELSDASKAKMALPVAEQGEPDEHIPGRLVVNIVKDGKVMVLGEEMNDSEINRVLKNEAALSMPSGEGFPSRAVLIRADQETKFGHVQKVMAQCMAHKLWRIAFATKDPNF